MIRRTADIIDVYGYNGDFCRVSPPGFSWGPELARGSTGLYEMPFQSNWVNYSFGSKFQSWKPKRRTVVATFDIANPDGPGHLTSDSDLWHTIYSRWKAMFSREHESRIVYTSMDGERELGVRTIDAPKPFSSHNFEGADPSLFAMGSIVHTFGCELPVYVGKPTVYEWETPYVGWHWSYLPYYNPGSLDCWPEWDVTGGSWWYLPDYSFGSEIHGRGLADAGKTVNLAPLMPTEDLQIKTRPDLETFITSLQTMYAGRMAGRDFEYPIPPGAGDPERGAIFRVYAANAGGARIRMTLPRWYDEPFSTARVV